MTDKPHDLSDLFAAVDRMNADTDQFIGKLNECRATEQLRRDAIEGITRDLTAPAAPTTPPQQPQPTSQFVTREYIQQVVEIIGEECGLAEAALRKKFDEKLESRIGAVEKMISKATELLESRLGAIEARDEFAGKHSKRIITKRDERGNLVADVIERTDGDPQNHVN